MLASLAVKLTRDHTAELIQSDDFMLQEKADGMRIMLGTSPTGAVTLLNRSGEATRVPKRTRLPFLPANSWIDFEFLSKQRFWVGLDLLVWSGNDLRLSPAELRYHTLVAAVLSMGPDTGVVRCAFDLHDKLALITTLKAERAEGIILKRRSAPYTHGEVVAGGPIYKDPWRKRLDAIAYRTSDTNANAKKSFDLYVYANAVQRMPGTALVHIGRVNAQDHWDAITPGKFRVVEIEYLYASADRRLVQPVIISYRDDKPPHECLADQMQVGGRHAVLAR